MALQVLPCKVALSHSRRAFFRPLLSFRLICNTHNRRSIRSIHNATGESVRSAGAGQLVKITGVSRKSLKHLKSLAGGRDGGGTAAGETSSDMLPVGETLFTVG